MENEVKADGGNEVELSFRMNMQRRGSGECGEEGGE